jgi:transmembrane 9 superfamily protein 2/4
MISFLFFSIGRASLTKIKPTHYKSGESIPVFAGSMRSPIGLLPLEYFYAELLQEPNQTLDLTTHLDPLFGKTLQKTPLTIRMNQNENCKNFSVSQIDKKKYSYYYYVVENRYEVSLLVDNLPFLTQTSRNNSFPNYPLGYIGVLDSKNFTSINEVHLIKHLHMTIFVKSEPNETFSIVSAYLKPYIRDPCTKNPPAALHLVNESIVTYSITWKSVKIKSENRFRIFLDNIRTVEPYTPNIKYIFLGMLLFIILGYVFFYFWIHHDVSHYKTGFQENDQELAGWEVVSGEVFRIPEQVSSYSFIISAGVRFGFDIFLQFAFHSVFDVMDPTNTDLFWLTFFVVDMIASFAAGFVSGWFMKEMNSKDVDTKRILDSLVPSLILFVLFLFMNLIFLSEESSCYIPFSTFLFGNIVVIFVSLGCHQGGSMLGYKLQRVEEPTRTNIIPRKIPEQPFPIQKLITFVGGIFIFAFVLPFLPSVKTALFCDYSIHRMIPEIAGMALILILASGLLSITGVYLILRREDFQWWIYGLKLPIYSGVFLFIAEMIYMLIKMWNIYFGTKVIFFSFALIEAFMTSVVAAAFGFLASMCFVFFIYRTFEGK